jgi:septum formation protein
MKIHWQLFWMCLAAQSFSFPLHSFLKVFSRQNLVERSTLAFPIGHPKRFSGRIMSIAATLESKDELLHADPLEGLPRPLILGSASFTRKLILEQMGIDYHVLVRSIDEKQVGYRDKDSPEDIVQAVAKAKMDHLVKEIMAGNCYNELPPLNNNKEWIVLTADQVVTCQGRILEKPTDVTQAKEFVAQYGKYPCSTVGCVVITHLPSKTSISGIHVAEVHFLQTFTPDKASALIDELIQNNEPILSCAGGLMIEHPLTQKYVDRIDGNVQSVMGLCPVTVRRLLRGLHASMR